MRSRLINLFKIIILSSVPLLFGCEGKVEQQGCFANLSVIDGAKTQFAIDQKLTNGATIGRDQLLPYLGLREWPKCPQGGEYSIGKVGEVPACSFPAHRGLLLPLEKSSGTNL